MSQQAQAEEEEATTIADMFPKLTVAQRKFGVNPAFRSYFDPSFKREDGIGEHESLADYNFKQRKWQIIKHKYEVLVTNH